MEERGGEVGAAEADQAGGGQGEELAQGVEAREVVVGERSGDKVVDACRQRWRSAVLVARAHDGAWWHEN